MNTESIYAYSKVKLYFWDTIQIFTQEGNGFEENFLWHGLFWTEGHSVSF